VSLSNGSGASSPDDIGQAALVGPDASQFEIVSDDCSNTTVAIGDSCQLSLRAAPTVTGEAVASLSIPSDDPTSPATVALSGTGTTPDLRVSPSSLQFGTQSIGEVRPTQTIDFDNSADGTGPLVAGGVSLAGADAGDFDLVFDNCSGASIPPGDDCQIGVRYAPVASGPSQASVQIPSNGSTLPVEVALSGTGVAVPAPPKNPACAKLRAKLKKAKKKTTRRKLRKRLKRLGC
jgi:trimeric autotransporter adhesin